jgi:nucleoside-diphosphate-sugar epimerase
MTRTLIAGCGYVGSALASLLVDAGNEVWGLRRDPTGLPEGVHPMSGDLTRLDSLGALPEQLDFVVYAAAPGGAGGDAERRYRSTYLDGLEVLLRALSDQGESPRRLFFLSSTAVYGQRRGEWVDEDSPTHPARATGEILLSAERVAIACPIPSTILRLGGIYGPTRTRLVRQVRAGEAVRRRGRPHYTNRIHRDDVVGSIHHLMGLQTVENLYLGVDSLPSDEAEVLSWLAMTMDLPEPRLQAEDEELPSTRAGSKRCRNRRLLDSGYTFRHPTYRDGYAQLSSDRNNDE